MASPVRATSSQLDPGEQHIVIGTAGHVDHGKSTLVRALTGIDPDRLAEEKAREMTIDLGFAWIDLPSGIRAGIVDVPGHERFIKNMLAGAGGIDLALLVIAADEGPMPQTREHLAILDLLGVTQGVVALTKIDMTDAEMVELVSEEVRDLLAGTGLAGLPQVPVSAVTGAGMAELVRTLDKAVTSASGAHHLGPARLPVDRVFSVQGFGTVVTGTVIGGAISVGQDVAIMPSGIASRVRGIQTHNRKVETIAMGNRAAINLAGVAVEDIRRGDVVTTPRGLQASTRVDVHLTMLKSAPALEQDDEIDFFSGSAVVPGWPTLLERDALQPGETGWVQIRLREPVSVAKGDRFIIRRPSPSETIGGGVVVDPHPHRHKRFRPDVISSLEVLERGSPEELVLDALGTQPVERRVLLDSLSRDLGVSQVGSTIDALIDGGKITVLSPRDRQSNPATYLIASSEWPPLLADIQNRLAMFHRELPLKRGMSREELRSKIRLPQRPFDAVIATAASAGVVVDDGAVLRLPGFSIQIDSASRQQADRFLQAAAVDPLSPPAPGDFGLTEELVSALVDRGEVVKVAEGILFLPGAYQQMVEGVMKHLDEHGTITLASFRDLFGTSRKYAQSVLEYFDQQKLTRRVGDERRRFSGGTPREGS